MAHQDQGLGARGSEAPMTVDRANVFFALSAAAVSSVGDAASEVEIASIALGKVAGTLVDVELHRDGLIYPSVLLRQTLPHWRVYRGSTGSVMISGPRAAGEQAKEFPLPDDARFIGPVDPLRYLVAACIELGLDQEQICVSALDFDRPYDSVYQRSKASVLARLRGLRKEVLALSANQPAWDSAVGQGAGQATDFLSMMERNLSAAIAAVESGLDENQTPISKADVASGLIRLCNHGSASAFSALQGAQMFEELRGIARELELLTPEYAR